MRVCQVTHTFLPKIGGREIHVFNLSRALADSGIDVEVFTGGGDRKPSLERFANFSVIRLPSISFPVTSGSSGVELVYRVIPSLPFMLMNFNFDLIHAHDYFHLSSDMSAWSSKLSRKPFVLSAHSMPSFFSVNKHLSLFEKVYNRSLGRLTLSTAEKIIFMSHYQAEKYLDLGVEKSKVEVVHPSVATDDFDEFLDNFGPGEKDFYAERFGFTNERIVLFVGRIEKRKGLQYLIEAVPNIVKEIPNARVAIVGPDAGYVQALRRRVNALGVGEYVFFTGVLSDLDVKRAIRNAHVFVLPSEVENFPEVILKVAYLKTPIVASNVGGVPEFVQDKENGLLVNVGDVEQLSKAIVTLLSDEQLGQKFGEVARKKVLQGYTMRQMAAQIVRIYREIVE